MRAWPEESKNGPTFSDKHNPFEEDRPIDDLWPLEQVGYSRGMLGNTLNFRLYEGGQKGEPGGEIMVSSHNRKEDDSFCIGFDLDVWEDYRKRKTFFLMPTCEVTRFEAMDIWEKANKREILGLMLEKVDGEESGFRRIGMFSVEAKERRKFWKIAVEGEIEDVTSVTTSVEIWPDLDFNVGSHKSWKYDVNDSGQQYRISLH